MKCIKCGKGNRQEALYCRFCGEEIVKNTEVVTEESKPVNNGNEQKHKIGRAHV